MDVPSERLAMDEVVQHAVEPRIARAADVVVRRDLDVDRERHEVCWYGLKEPFTV